MSAKYYHITDRLHQTELRWFALRTANRHEKIAARQLKKRGVDCFLPLQQISKHYESKTVIRERCLLPGFIFVRINRSFLSAIYDNPYVQFLKIGQQRLDIPVEEIEILRRIIGEKNIKLAWELQPFTKWEAGQKVELIGGQLTGLKGTYLKHHNKGHLVISLGLLPPGMGLQAVVPSQHIRPLELGCSAKGTTF